MRDIKEQLEELIAKIEKANAIIDFLKELSIAEKKQLVPTIKKLEKKYTESIPYGEKNEWGHYKHKQFGSDEQVYALSYAAFFCMNEKDFSKLHWGMPSYLYELELHRIYSPDWFSHYINRPNNASRISYKELITLYQEGYLELSPALVALKLPNVIAEELEEPKYQYRYTMEQLYIDPITVKEHIWYLFSEEGHVNYRDKYSDVDGQRYNWKRTFATLIERKEINRQRVLRECLLSSTRNFNKVFTGWFFDLFLYLKPTKEENLSLQEDFFLVFNSQHSKPINVCLKQVKSICTEADFKVNDFLENASILLHSEVKAVVNSTLMILDKLAKKDKNHQAQICEIATNAFSHKDQKIQIRTANLLQKYGDKNATSLLEQIAVYHPELFGEVKKLLSEFDTQAFLEESSLETTVEFEKLSKISTDNQIPLFETNEEIIFFFAQVFENNEDYHFDLFLEYLPQLVQRITDENFDQLEPIFQRASKTLKKGSQRTGRVETYMSFIFCQVIKRLMDKFPGRKSFESIYKACAEVKMYIRTSADYKYTYKSINDQFDEQDLQNNYRPFFSRLLHSKQLCEKNLVLPMLATPTHAPCWLTIDAFIARLEQYQTEKEAIHLVDFQVAIARVVLENAASCQAKIVQSLTGEIKDLLLYLIDVNPLDLEKCKTPSNWLMVIYRKGNKKELEQFLTKFDKYNRSQFLLENTTWAVEYVDEEQRVYNYKKNETEKKIVQRKYLELKEPIAAKEISQAVLNKLKSQHQILDSIYHEYLPQEGNHICPNDDKKIVYLSPHCPDLILKLNIAIYLKQIQWTDADQDRSATNYIEALLNIWEDMGALTYLQLACTLFYLKKTSRQLAAELWLQTTSQNKMDNKLLGICLGKLSFNEYASLKRLTDLMLEQMMNVSKQHNKALEQLLINMIPEMNNKPIKGTKKLLEIYTELLSINQSKVSPIVQKKFEQWRGVVSSSLKKLLGKLMRGD